MIGHAGATGHALRRIIVTTLANDPAVSTEGAGIYASRHTSVSAYRGYQVIEERSEAAKFAALGLEKK